MTKQHLSIAGAWDVTVCYGVTPDDLSEVAWMMRRLGAGSAQVLDAMRTLSGWNCGVTFTSENDRESIVFIGRADSSIEFFNTIDHEIDHVQDHVARHYSVRLGTERAAYLQGYIGGFLWDFVFRHLLNNGNMVVASGWRTGDESPASLSAFRKTRA